MRLFLASGLAVSASDARAKVPCVGDCDLDERVAADELVTGVGIGLGAPLERCQAFDADANGRVAVDELIEGVGNALGECPAFATPTPTPTGRETRTPTILSGLVEVESFALGAGELVLAAADLTVRAAAGVRIDGELRAADAGGQNVTIEAGGALALSGSIAAGNGEAAIAFEATLGPVAAGDGGSVVLVSASDITIEAGANVVAGDGTDGGDGGDVVLQANGTIAIPDEEDVIHLGDGGDNASLSESPSDSGPEDLDNRGGDSGLILMSAKSVTGIAVERVELVRDFSPANGALASRWASRCSSRPRAGSFPAAAAATRDRSTSVTRRKARRARCIDSPPRPEPSRRAVGSRSIRSSAAARREATASSSAARAPTSRSTARAALPPAPPASRPAPLVGTAEAVSIRTTGPSVPAVPVATSRRTAVTEPPAPRAAGRAAMVARPRRSAAMAAKLPRRARAATPLRSAAPQGRAATTARRARRSRAAP